MVGDVPVDLHGVGFRVGRPVGDGFESVSDRAEFVGPVSEFFPTVRVKDVVDEFDGVVDVSEFIGDDGFLVRVSVHIKAEFVDVGVEGFYGGTVVVELAIQRLNRALKRLRRVVRRVPRVTKWLREQIRNLLSVVGVLQCVVEWSCFFDESVGWRDEDFSGSSR